MQRWTMFTGFGVGDGGVGACRLEIWGVGAMSCPATRPKRGAAQKNRRFASRERSAGQKGSFVPSDVGAGDQPVVQDCRGTQRSAQEHKFLAGLRSRESINSGASSSPTRDRWCGHHYHQQKRAGGGRAQKKKNGEAGCQPRGKGERLTAKASISEEIGEAHCD